MEKIKNGNIEVTERGIEKVKFVDSNTYMTEMIMTKEAFIEAYNKYIRGENNE